MLGTIININIGSTEIETYEQMVNRLKGSPIGKHLGLNEEDNNPNDVLVIFSSYEDGPDFFLFNSTDELGKMAISCDRLVINGEQEGFSEEQIDFVDELGNSAYKFKNSDKAEYEVSENVSGTFKYIIRCGFYP